MPDFINDNDEQDAQPVIGECAACGQTAEVSDAQEHGLTFTEALCDECRWVAVRESQMDSFDRSYEHARANGWAD